jgi:hypothetical protein
MQKHLPLISVTVTTLVVLAALHFLVFAPKTREFDRVQEDLATNIDGLKERIGMIEWSGDKPDPRSPSFSWEKLLEKVEETYEGTLAGYDRLIESINVDLPTYPEEQVVGMILEKIAALQELEEKNRNLQILEKWGLNSTAGENGYNGTRGLDLRFGGFRTYSAEDRIYGPKGTIQFAVDISPWYIDDLATYDPGANPPQVLFHAVKHNPRPEGTPDNLHLGFSSEIQIRREGTQLIASISTGAGVGPGAMRNKTEATLPIELLPLLVDTSGKSPWKVLKLTWGPEPSDFMFYLDGQQAGAFNTAPRGGGGGYGDVDRGEGYYGGGGGYRGEGGDSPYGYGGGRYGGGRGYGGGGAAESQGISVETLDSLAIGTDLQTDYPAPLRFDAFRIWDAVSSSGDPTVAPLFKEDFSVPFGSEDELRRSLTQLFRYQESRFDPLYSEDVKSLYRTLFAVQIGSAGVQGRGHWIDSMRSLAFLDYASKAGPDGHGDIERMAQQISVPVPGPETLRNVAVFLDLTLDLVRGMLDAEVDSIDQVAFLNWSNTVSDEPLKEAFKLEYEGLKELVRSTQALGGGMMMGMGGMGMGGMGMGGMGMGGMGMGGGMGYGDSYGGYPGSEYRGGEMYGGGYEDGPVSDSKDIDPEELAERKRKREEKQKKAQEDYAANMEKVQKLEENQEKLKQWNIHVNSNEVAPEFYATYRDQTPEGKTFFIRYSLKTQFQCSKETLAKALHSMEYGEWLVFLSHVNLGPNPSKSNSIDVIANVEYNFMKELGSTELVGSATTTEVMPPSSSAGAGL